MPIGPPSSRLPLVILLIVVPCGIDDNDATDATTLPTELVDLDAPGHGLSGDSRS